MAIIGLMVLAGLFVVVVGFWAVTLDGGREAEPEVQPTPTLGERPQNMLRVLVQSEAGEPFPAALVEFRDRLDQVVATQLTDQDGHAEALVTVGDYSVAVRIPGYEVARLPDLVVTAQDAPRHTVTVQPAQRGASAAPTAATTAPAAGSEAATPAPTPSAGGSEVASAAPTVSSGGQTAPSASTPASAAADTTVAAPTAVPAPAPQLIVAHPDARFTTIDPASNLALRHQWAAGMATVPLTGPSPQSWAALDRATGQ